MYNSFHNSKVLWYRLLAITKKRAPEGSILYQSFLIDNHIEWPHLPTDSALSINTPATIDKAHCNFESSC